MALRNGLIRNKLVLRNHFMWTICHLFHRDKELLALRNNFRATKSSLLPSSTVWRKFTCHMWLIAIFVGGLNFRRTDRLATFCTKVVRAQSRSSLLLRGFLNPFPFTSSLEEPRDIFIDLYLMIYAPWNCTFAGDVKRVGPNGPDPGWSPRFP